ncbi:hypothetical protein PV703_26245 [Streptomyces sp. ME01-24h]|nr:hypothetical protein [Streptomyces sp. ME19-03-3]MDX3356738.1 hypothetical protein [Streptomyces sp. ME01-24h]
MPKTQQVSKVVKVVKVVMAADNGAGARQARFGALPERVRPEDTTEVVPVVARYPSQDLYDHEKWLTCRWV